MHATQDRRERVEAGLILGGKYRIEKRLASGGMGSVWIALDLKLERNVAIKFIDHALLDSSEARGRFEREARASAQLQSPHVAAVFDYGTQGSTPYLVMELLAGESLFQRLKRESPLPLEALLPIVTQACKGLQHAHENGIIHRDIKPGNIFLARISGEDVVKILDFGVARAQWSMASAEQTKTGLLVGSPHYMSPEQIRSAKTCTAQSDLWSLGVVVFKALTGQYPFDGNLAEVLLSIRNGSPALAHDLNPTLPPSLDMFFASVLAKDPERRPRSARDFAVALAQHLASGPGADQRPGKLAALRATIPMTLPVAPADDLAAEAAKPKSASEEATTYNGTPPPQAFRDPSLALSRAVDLHRIHEPSPAPESAPQVVFVEGSREVVVVPASDRTPAPQSTGEDLLSTHRMASPVARPSATPHNQEGLRSAIAQPPPDPQRTPPAPYSEGGARDRTALLAVVISGVALAIVLILVVVLFVMGRKVDSSTELTQEAAMDAGSPTTLTSVEMAPVAEPTSAPAPTPSTAVDTTPPSPQPSLSTKPSTPAERRPRPKPRASDPSDAVLPDGR